MIIKLGKTRDEISEMRKDAILAEWPYPRQFEAMTEAGMGRPEKLEALNAFLLDVKARFPYKD